MYIIEKINIKIEVDDDFQAGDCYNCPFSYDESYEVDGYIETDLVNFLKEIGEL